MHAKCARPEQIILEEEEFVWERVDETRRSTRRFPPTAAPGAYNQADAGGFIKLNALRMRIAAKRGRK